MTISKISYPKAVEALCQMGYEILLTTQTTVYLQYKNSNGSTALPSINDLTLDISQGFALEDDLFEYLEYHGVDIAIFKRQYSSIV